MNIPLLSFERLTKVSTVYPNSAIGYAYPFDTPLGRLALPFR